MQHRTAPGCWAAMMLACLGFLAGTAQATPLETAAASPLPAASACDADECEGRFRLGVGAGLLMGVSTITERRADDHVLYSSPGGLLDLSIAAAYRVWPLSRVFWHLAAEGRYQPQTRRGFYASLRGGAAAMVDGYGDDSVTQWGPLASGAVGYDFRVAPILSLGVELQGAWAWFGERGGTVQQQGESRSYPYGSSRWLGFAAGLARQLKEAWACRAA